LKLNAVIALILLLFTAWFFWPEDESPQSKQVVSGQSAVADKRTAPNAAAQRNDSHSSLATKPSQTSPAAGQAPVVSAPPDVTVTTKGSTPTALVSLGEATVSDDRDANLRATPDHAGLFPIGIHQVTWRATDSDGLTGEAVQQVMVMVKRSVRLRRMVVYPFQYDSDSTTFTLLKGERVPLQVLASGELDAESHWIEADAWQGELSNPKSASLQEGVLLGIAAGKTALTIRFAGLSKAFRVEVIEGSFSALRFKEDQPKEIGLYQSITARVEAKLPDGRWVDVSARARCHSSNPSVLQRQEAVNVRDAPMAIFDARASGEANLIADYMGLTATQQLHIRSRKVISISFSEQTGNVLLGEQGSLYAKVQYDDGNDYESMPSALQFSSSSPEVVEIVRRLEGRQSRERVMIAHKVGTTTISATLGGVSASHKLRVIAKIDRLFLYLQRNSGRVGEPIAVNAFGLPVDAMILHRLEALQQEGFTGAALKRNNVSMEEIYREAVWLTDLVEWRSSSPDVAVFGLIPHDYITYLSLMKAGQTTISATMGALQSSQRLTVSGDISRLRMHIASQLELSRLNGDLTQWVKQVDDATAKGTPIALLIGTEWIQAALFVDDAQGNPLLLRAQAYECTSDDPSIATILSSYNGLSLLAAGETTIRCLLRGTSKRLSQKIVVMSEKAEGEKPERVYANVPAMLRAYDIRVLEIKGVYPSGIERVINNQCKFHLAPRSVIDLWSSKRRNLDWLQGLKSGLATLAFSCMGVESKDYSPYVINNLQKIRIDPQLVHLQPGERHTLNYFRYFDDGSMEQRSETPATWESSNPEVLRIEGEELVAVASGTATLRIVLDDFSDQMMVQVHLDAPVRLQLTPASLDLAMTKGYGDQVPFPRIDGYYSDGSSHRLQAKDCSWQINQPGVVIRLRYESTKDLTIKGETPGDYQVVVNCSGTEAILPVSVSRASLLSTRIVMQPYPVHEGDVLTLTLLGRYDDGAERVLDPQYVNWTSSDPVGFDANNGVALLSGKKKITLSARYIQLFGSKKYETSIAFEVLPR